MHETIRSILRFYVLSGIWFAFTVGIGFAALGPVGVVLSGIGASALVKAMTVMAIAIAMASLVTWLLWVSFPVRRARTVSSRRQEHAHATTFTSTRTTVRS